MDAAVEPIHVLSVHSYHDTASAAALFKENMNASKPSYQSKGLGGNIGCRDKNPYMVLKGFPM